MQICYMCKLYIAFVSFLKSKSNRVGRVCLGPQVHLVCQNLNEIICDRWLSTLDRKLVIQSNWSNYQEMFNLNMISYHCNPIYPFSQLLTKMCRYMYIFLYCVI